MAVIVALPPTLPSYGVSADGRRHTDRVHETGTGPALVLVHGITESHQAWDPIVHALSEQWHVVAVDLRGHGASERSAPYDPVTLASDLHALVGDRGLEIWSTVFDASAEELDLLAAPH